MTKIINNVQELRDAIEKGNNEFYILIGGMMRSSKTIYWDEDNKKFLITNEIDDSEQDLTDDELYTMSNIGEAIQKGSFLMY